MNGRMLDDEMVAQSSLAIRLNISISVPLSSEIICNLICLNLLYIVYMTGLLHEGIFHVRGLIKPVIFGSLHWAEILICGRH